MFAFVHGGFEGLMALPDGGLFLCDVDVVIKVIGDGDDVLNRCL